MVSARSHRSSVPAEPDCPCSSGRTYAQCCGRLHGGEPAADAETLMRSRYSAYVLGLADYLAATWHSNFRPPLTELQQLPARQWLGLTIRQATDDGNARATVEFIARFKINGRAYRLHETSRFVREHGRWWYCDGDIHPA